MRIVAPTTTALRVGRAVAAVLLLAGCGSQTHSAPATAVHPTASPLAGLRVGIVGKLDVQVPGAVTVSGPLARVADLPLVVVRGPAPGLAAAADAHPSTHFALVGRSWRTVGRQNVAGLVFRESEAAYLAGVVAALAVEDSGVSDARVAWIGPRSTDVVTAFEGGARSTIPGLVVLHGYAASSATLCKEDALGAIRRQAAVIMTAHGPCAAGALEAAREQNAVGLGLQDFELPRALATQAVADAVAGRYHGGEDVVFDASSGAIGIGRLDPHLSADAEGRARAAAQELADGLRSPR